MMVDPISVEIIRCALRAAADEMSMVLKKTAYNMMIYEVQDYCVGIVDSEGRTISQNQGALPIFLADLGVSVRDGVELYGAEAIHSGDVFLVNHPEICGQHLNNMVVYTPFVWDDRLLFFLAVRAHWIDVGGASTGFGSSMARDVFEEGIQIRSVKVYKRGKPNTEVLRLIEDNIRFPESSLGDLRAQIAACHTGEERLREICRRYGPDRVLEAVRVIWDQTDKIVRRSVRSIPNGIYKASSALDNDGMNLEKPVPIKIVVEVRDEEMTVDFSGVSDQVGGFINCGASGGMAAARVAFKSLTLPKGEVNDGSFRALKIVLPPGKFLSARRPAPIGGWSLALPVVIETILRSVSPALPDRIPAAHKGDMGGYTLFGVHPKTGRRYVCQNITGGGWGGRPFEDGENASVSVCQGDVKNAPIELQELYFPLLFERHALRADSGGAGRYRGGLGVDIKIRSLHDTYVSRNMEMTRCPPWGLWGGRESLPSLTIVEQPDGSAEAIQRKISHLLLRAGGSVTFLSAGGGGYGDPALRDAGAIKRDLLFGYVSKEKVERDYPAVFANGSAEEKRTGKGDSAPRERELSPSPAGRGKL